MTASAADSIPPKPWRKNFQQRLRAWYTKQHRSLPWRDEPTLYRVWISEIMLQQTQVVTVIDYFNRFLVRFPDVTTLAEAAEEEVLRYWEGLGYYRRARQLHAAAKVIMEQHGGEFPAVFDEVLALPGVGRYTAGAILSIGGGQRHPILEANTIRLFARLMALDADVQSKESQAKLWEFAEQILPPRKPGDFNQALMELGSEVCRPRDPHCLLCPVQSLCPTHAAGREEEIPRPKKKTEWVSVTHLAAIIGNGQPDSGVLLRKHLPGERFAGLWDFPRIELATKTIKKPPGKLDEPSRSEFDRLLGFQPELAAHFTTIRHGITRYRITLHCYHMEATAADLKRVTGEMNWRMVQVSELGDVPLSSTGRKIAKLLMEGANSEI